MKTNKNILNIALGALLALALPGVAMAQQMKTLSGHVPRAVSRFNLQPIGQLPDGTNLTLAISLPVQNEPALDSLLSQIYDPSSTNYHHYLTQGEFSRRFGPSAADHQKVLDFVKAHNLAVVRSYSNQMLVDVSGKASDIESAFHVKLRTYHHPVENRTFFAPDTDPTVDSSVPISHVSGLDNYLIPRPAFIKEGTPTRNPGATKPGSGSGPGGTYMGKDFRAAYVPGVSLDGKGQNVALYELDGYFTADILSYEAQAGLANVTLTNISVNGGVPAPTGFGDPEVSLDIEMVVSMATNASEVIVYEAPNGVANSVVDLLNRIASDDLAKQISSSWLIGDDPSYDVYYKEMALQGQSFFQASGDNGAYFTNQEQLQQWADDTNITLVGGTTLSTIGPGGAWSSETVWNWFSEGIGTDGSGGGTNWNGIPIPSWQQNVPMTNNMGSTTLRNVPDVSLTADAIYVVFENGQSGFFGGTSCAAPLWAAYTALVNEQATNRDLPSVGFLNPALYAIGLSSNYTNCFHDITTGNDTNLVVGNRNFAVPGYDLATGWGTPNGSNLINALTASASTNFFTHLSPPSPPYGSTLVTLNGGNPNGNWELFALNDQTFNSGAIANGWSLALTAANPVGFVADDDLTMTASGTSVLTNSDVTFTIGVTNFGPNTSSNVVVLDNLPFGFTFISASATVGTIANAGQTITWNVTNSLIDTLGAQMTLKLQAPNSQEEAENSATVTPGTPDQNPADSSAFVIVNVTTPAPPLLSSLSMGPGGTFHLSISNSSSQLPVIIQSSTNLVNWVNVDTNSPPFTYTDTVTPGFPTRFYRALVQ
jgi:uncharacterized repeat protein (TIGR01451 family)